MTPPEEKHVLTVLKTIMRVLGHSNRDLERKLKLSGSYLSRLFSGDLDLRFSHLLDLSRALGLAPEEMLRLVYPPEPGLKSPAAERLKTFLDSLQPTLERQATPAGKSPTRQEIEMREAIEKVLSGIVETLGPVPLFGGISDDSPAALAVSVGEAEIEPRPRAPRRKRGTRKTEA